jgi:hypothetical protein
MRSRKNFAGVMVVLAVVAASLTMAGLAAAQTETVLYNFGVHGYLSQVLSAMPQAIFTGQLAMDTTPQEVPPLSYRRLREEGRRRPSYTVLVPAGMGVHLSLP